jgi:quinol monooxygenase YgiN
MVPKNDPEILRIRGVTRPLPGKREEAVELCKKMQDTSKPHIGVRDYQWYADPDTGELVIWESYDPSTTS